MVNGIIFTFGFILVILSRVCYYKPDNNDISMYLTIFADLFGSALMLVTILSRLF